MPKKPAAANLDNPIRKLRQQLKLTQDKLGEYLGMNGDAIRNLENGRMALSGRIFHRIIDPLGAEYRHKKKTWFVPLSKTPCSPTTLFVWRQASKPNEELKRNDRKCLNYRIDALLESVSPQQYHALFIKIYEFLDDCLQEHPSEEATEAFKRSAPRMVIVRRSGTTPVAYEDHLFTSFEEVEGLEGPDLVERQVVERRPLIISEITRSYQKFPTGRFKRKPRGLERPPPAA
jgi:transcriptional regulator with XRE-family HTH domain